MIEHGLARLNVVHPAKLPTKVRSGRGLSLWLGLSCSALACAAEEGVSSYQLEQRAAPDRSSASEARAPEETSTPFCSRVSPVPRARGEVAIGDASYGPARTTGAAAEDIGPGAELCPEGARDADEDGLCDHAEAHYRTDPARADSDGDQLNDFDELFGLRLPDLLDAEGEPTVLDLPRYRANPLRRDVYVEVDYYPENEPSQAALERVVEAFADAPLDNPDGSQGIALHVLIDDKVTAGADRVLGNPHADLESDRFYIDIWFDVAPIKTRYADRIRHAAFHYSLWANRIRGSSSSGMSFEAPAHDFLVTFGGEPADEMKQAGTFMHELGHNLGLLHGGHHDENHQPNYFSVMNYIYQFDGLTRCGADVLDYSRHPVAELDENAIDERAAMSPGPGVTESDLASYRVRLCLPKFGFCKFEQIQLGNASENLDLDYSTNISEEPYALDLDLDEQLDVIPASRNDWEALTFDGSGMIGVPNSWQLSGHAEAPTLAPCPGPDDIPAPE
jgi:hypothetical protein